MSINLNRVQNLIEKLAFISSVSNELTRLAFTEEDEKAHHMIIELCKEYDLSIRRDSIGNLFIRKEGKEDFLPVVAFGSHIDTVVNAGKFDGPLGSVAGLEILLQLYELNIQTRYPLELIIFTCEESSRFNFATLESYVRHSK